MTLPSQQVTSGLAVELLGSLESEDMKLPEVGICALPSKRDPDECPLHQHPAGNLLQQQPGGSCPPQESQ